MEDRLNAFDTWDKGERTYDGDMHDLKSKELGEQVQDAFSRSTICPVGNKTCFSYMDVEIYGVHPDPEIGNKKETIMLCSIGIKDIAECPLSR